MQQQILGCCHDPRRNAGAAPAHQHRAEISAVPGGKDAREIVQRLLLPMAIVSAAIAGYRDEMNHILDAEAIYLGPGK